MFLVLAWAFRLHRQKIESLTIKNRIHFALFFDRSKKRKKVKKNIKHDVYPKFWRTSTLGKTKVLEKNES